jgi:hypothetical protein
MLQLNKENEDVVDGVIKLSSPYFQLFDRMIIKNGAINFCVILFNERHFDGGAYLFQEFSSITKKTNELFGVDLQKKGEFIYEEFEEIICGEWEGREWQQDNLKVIFKMEKIERNLPLYIIGPFANNE